MDLQPTRIRLTDETTYIDAQDHDVKVETCHVKVMPIESLFVDDRHINVIIDGVLVALMAKWRLYRGDLLLFPCVITSCYCKFTGPVYARALTAETDITLSDPIRQLVESSAIDQVAA